VSVRLEDVQVGANLTLTNFLHHIDKEERHWPKLYFMNGNAYIYECSSSTHESIKGKLLVSIYNALGQDNVDVMGSILCSTVPGFSREPDLCVFPANATRPGPGNRVNAIDDKGNPWPSVIVEV
jgi:Uma2 family endonuclease